MVSFFHSYDLRGTYPDEIGETEAERVGKAYGTYVNGKVLVGRDARDHSGRISEAFIKGIRSVGTDVVDAGEVPTPVVYFGSKKMDVDSSAVVTASHNPSEYTGFKFTREDALAMSRDGGMKEIEEIYEEKNFGEGKGSLEKVDLKSDYIEFVSELFEIEDGIKIAINYGNGITSVLGRELFENLGCDVLEVNEELDGSFPNHLPAPGAEEAQKQLKDAMSDQELGIIFDGDGDRSGFIYNDEYIPEDQVISIMSESILEDQKGKVVHDLRSSKLVKEIVEQHGGKAIETRVGHTFISEKIHEDSNIVFAGELSGHYYFPSLGVPWDDGIVAAAFMMEIHSEGDIDKMLEEYPDYPVSPELRIDCPEGAKKPVVDDIAEEYCDHDTSEVDGVKVYFNRGWALVRPSNTEEKMSVRCEADSKGDLDRILSEIEEKVRNSIKRNS